MSLPQNISHTTEDIYALPEGQRAELIDGNIYMMAPPKRINQELVSQFTKIIGQYIDLHKRLCKVYPTSFPSGIRVCKNLSALTPSAQQIIPFSIWQFSPFHATL